MPPGSTLLNQFLSEMRFLYMIRTKGQLQGYYTGELGGVRTLAPPRDIIPEHEIT